MTTSAPASASTWAMPLPMPRPAPVTKATVPLRSYSGMLTPGAPRSESTCAKSSALGRRPLASRHYHDLVPTSATCRDARRPWIVVGAVWVALAVAFGLYFSFPVFFVALLEEFGWSRAATAGAFSLSSVVQGALSPFIGMLVDRLGPRRVMLAGTLLLGGSCALSSAIDSLWSLYLVTGVLVAAGVGAVGWVPSGALL